MKSIMRIIYLNIDDLKIEQMYIIKKTNTQ